MADASEKMNFEEAAALRDRIAAIKNITDKQKVFTTSLKDQDVIAFMREGADCCMQVFFFRGGKLLGREHFILEDTEFDSDEDIMANFVKQFYNKASFVPKEIIVQNEFEDIKVLQSLLSNVKASAVKINCPKRGEQLKLVEMVKKNAAIALEQFRERIIKEDGFKNLVFLEMQKIMGFDRMPARIESYDISNTGMSEVVGSMVVALNGQLTPKEYKRFKIKTIDIQNDYGSMQEMIERRFTHSKRNGGDAVGSVSAREGISGDAVGSGSTRDSTGGDAVGSVSAGGNSRSSDDKLKGFDAVPDLILVDGGIGHVNAVREVLSGLNIEINVWGMVKDDKHRTKGVVSPVGKETDLKGYPSLFRFITETQDETHRFAIEYNKHLRKKRYERSVLDDINGIGPSKKKILLKHFGSAAAVKKAGIDDLASVDGISEGLALSIFRHFHPNEN